MRRMWFLQGFLTLLPFWILAGFWTLDEPLTSRLPPPCDDYPLPVRVTPPGWVVRSHVCPFAHLIDILYYVIMGLVSDLLTRCLIFFIFSFTAKQVWVRPKTVP